MELTKLRIQLAEAQIALRYAKDDHETARAIHEQAAIDCGDAGGKNAEERSRSLTRALSLNVDYLETFGALREAEADVDMLRAQIAAEEDARDAEKLRIRDESNKALDRLAAAYERMARCNPVVAAIDAALPL